MERNGSLRSEKLNFHLGQLLSELVSLVCNPCAGLSDVPITIEDVNAVLAASVFHYGTLSIAEVKQALAEAGFPVRLPINAG